MIIIVNVFISLKRVNSVLLCSQNAPSPDPPLGAKGISNGHHALIHVCGFRKDWYIFQSIKARFYFCFLFQTTFHRARVFYVSQSFIDHLRQARCDDNVSCTACIKRRKYQSLQERSSLSSDDVPLALKLITLSVFQDMSARNWTSCWARSSPLRKQLFNAIFALNGLINCN